MASFGFLGGLVFYVIGLFILYLIIQLAVRHGIDNSVTGRMIQKKYREEKNNYGQVDEQRMND